MGKGDNPNLFFLIAHQDENTKRRMCYIVTANLITHDIHGNRSLIALGTARQGQAGLGAVGRGKVRHSSEAGLGRAGCG
jgi:hypothetical protein